MSEIVRYRGDTIADQFVIRAADGTPINIAGAAFTLTVSPIPEPANAAAELFYISGVIIDAANGVVEFAPTAEQADQLPGRYWYDVEMADSGGRLATVAKGAYVFVQDITK